MKRQGPLFVIGQFILIVLLIVSPSIRNVAPGMKLLGFVIQIAGLLLVIVGGINLRKSLTANPEPRKGGTFVVTGLYKWVRHPMYLGLIVFGIGITIQRESILAEIETLFLAILLHFKRLYEDQLLLEKYPEAAEYQQRVGAFIPKTDGKKSK
ncbi:MAG: isoprenylcysteine carboxylmethyltransferase family protein [Actinomycetes bacterium]